MIKIGRVKSIIASTIAVLMVSTNVFAANFSGLSFAEEYAIEETETEELEAPIEFDTVEVCDDEITMVSAAIVDATVTSSAERVYQCSEYYGDNYERQNYINSTVPGISFLTVLSDGSLLRFQGTNGTEGYYAQYFNSDMKFIKEVRIPAELGEFGAFHYDGANFYVLTGQDNIYFDDSDKRDTAEVYRVTKYDSSWRRVASKSFYGEDTKTAFNWGSAHMVSDGNQLFVRTCHEMYSGHQSNITMSINTTDMTGRVVSGGYASHSFEQYIRLDNGVICTVDHGDAYPRSIRLNKFMTSYKSDPESYSAKALDVIGFAGSEWQTGASLGGFEISSSHYVIVGNINDQTDILNSTTCNVFVASVDKNNMSASGTKVTKLTDYQEGEEGASTPRLVNLGSDGFMLLWSCKETVYYCRLNTAGELVGNIYSFKGFLSDCHPVVYGSKVVWYVFKEGDVTFYSIDRGNYASVISDTKMMGHDYTDTYASSSNNWTAHRYCNVCKTQLNYKALSDFWTFFQNNATTFSYQYMSQISVNCGDNLEFLIQSKVPANADLYQVEVTSSDENIVKAKSGVFNSSTDTSGKIIIGQGNGGDVETATLYFTGMLSTFYRTLKVTVTHHYEYTETIPAGYGKNAVKRYVCSGCGGVRDEIIEGTANHMPEFGGMAASLSTNVCAIFDMAYLPADGYVRATGQFGTVLTAVKDIPCTDGVYEFRCEIPIKYMGEDATLEVLDAGKNPIAMDCSGTQSQKLTWNIYGYLDYIRAKYASDAVMVNLIDTYKAYSDEAARYFGVRSLDKENTYGSVSELSSYAKNFPAAVNGKTAQMPSGLEYLGSALILDNKVTVRHYFAGDITGCKAVIDNKSVQFVKISGNLYYIESEKMEILKADEMKTVIVDNGAQYWAMLYCPLSYCYDATTATAGNASYNQNLDKLTRSMYLYWVAAENYNRVYGSK